MSNSDVVWFDEVGVADVARVGGKNASLGEMIRALSAVGIRVPDGFATTAAAYRAFLAHNGLDARIGSALAEYRSGEKTLAIAGEEIREAFLLSEFPPGLAESISSRLP